MTKIEYVQRQLKPMEAFYPRSWDDMAGFREWLATIPGFVTVAVGSWNDVGFNADIVMETTTGLLYANNIIGEWNQWVVFDPNASHNNHSFPLFDILEDTEFFNKYKVVL